MTSRSRLLPVLALAAYALAAGAHTDSDPFAEHHDHPAGEDAAPVAEVRMRPELLELAEVSPSAPTRGLRTYGRVVPSSAALRDVNAYISGQIREVFVRPGEWVEAGERIVGVYSPEFMLTQSAYLSLLNNDDKLRELREEGRLRNYLADARENLRWWGMGDEDIEALEARNTPVEMLWVRTPRAGVVTELFVEKGQLINAGDRAMQNFLVVGVAVARMALAEGPLWLEGYTYADDLGALQGEGVVARIATGGGTALERPVTHVAPAVDEDTQLGRFVVELGEDPAGLVLGQTVPVDLARPGAEGAWLPRAAVLGQGIDPVVYVQRAPDRYERRRIEVREHGAGALRAAGVAPGERVVTAGKMLLEGSYRMGAGGGADDHHHH